MIHTICITHNNDIKITPNGKFSALVRTKTQKPVLKKDLEQQFNNRNLILDGLFWNAIAPAAEDMW